MKLSKKDMSLIADNLADKPMSRAWVFGSKARGDSRSGSDVDILVELDYREHIGLGFATMQMELEQSLNKKIDLVSLKAVSKHIQPFIDRDKQLIYE